MKRAGPIVLASLVALPALAQDSRPARPEAPPAKEAAGLTLAPQPGWKREQPQNRMRLAQFLLPAREGGADVRVVIFRFPGQGGSADANFARWRRQVGAKAEDAAVVRWAQHGLAVHLLDARGRYTPMAAPGGAKPRTVEDARLLGAILEGAGDPYFVKLVGPAADVARWEPSFQAFLASLRGGKPRGVRFYAPAAAWTPTPPTSRMRAAEFVIADEAGPLRAVVYHFGEGRGGSVEQNFTRWIGQFQDASAPAKKKLQGAGVTAHTLALTGTYAAETRPGSGERVSKPGYALRAAVVEGGDGPYFVKLVGPKAAIERHAAAFEAFVKDGFRPLKAKKPKKAKKAGESF